MRPSWRQHCTWISQTGLRRNQVCAQIRCPTEKEKGFTWNSCVGTHWHPHFILPHREPGLSTSVQVSSRIWGTTHSLGEFKQINDNLFFNSHSTEQWDRACAAMIGFHSNSLNFWGKFILASYFQVMYPVVFAYFWFSFSINQVLVH